MTSGLSLALELASGQVASEDAGSAPATRPSLLRDAALLSSEGAPKAAVLSDGIASTDGDVWDSPRSAILAVKGTIEWDLGAPSQIAAMRIQADNNDRYLISGSQDRVSWYPLWVAGPVDLPGVQTRTSSPLNANARYVRLAAEGGDSKYSITELELFDSLASLRAAQLQRVAPPPPPPPPPAPPFDTGFVVVFAAIALFVFYFQWVRRLRRAEEVAPPAAPPQPPPDTPTSTP